MSDSAGSLLQAWARRGVTQPIDRPVPSDDAAFLAKKGAPKIAFRVAKHRLELAASGQRVLLAERIDPGWVRAVWFHAEAPQIGDALMDLAPRSLFAARGVALDLVAPARIASVFRGDRWFARVIGDRREVVAANYDVAIVDSVSWRALAAKRAVAPRLPWVTVLGDYLAYDFQRGSFAARRLAALLQMQLDPAAERLHARQKLQRAGDVEVVRDDPPRIAIALGGVRAERTYGHWPAVAQALRAAGHTRFALLGSDNAKAAAAAVKAAIPGADVLDLVAATDLHGTQQAMARCALVLCADGGLLHLACTTTTPTVALFDASIDPAWRLPVDDAITSLRCAQPDVSGVAAGLVAERALALLGRPAVLPSGASAGGAGSAGEIR